MNDKTLGEAPTSGKQSLPKRKLSLRSIKRTEIHSMLMMMMMMIMMVMMMMMMMMLIQNKTAHFNLSFSSY